MSSKLAKFARVEFVMVGESLVVFDFGDFGIIIDRMPEFQSLKVLRGEGHGELSEIIEAEVGLGCEIPSLEVRRHHFLQIQEVVRRKQIDLGELDRLLKLCFPKILAYA